MMHAREDEFMNVHAKRDVWHIISEKAYEAKQQAEKEVTMNATANSSVHPKMVKVMKLTYPNTLKT